MHRIGIDLGGTKIELIVTKDDSMKVLHRTRVATVRTSYEELLEQLADLVGSVREVASQNPRVGVGAPGFVDPITGAIGSSNLRILPFGRFRKICHVGSGFLCVWLTMPTVSR